MFGRAILGSWGNIFGVGVVPDAPVLVLVALEDGTGLTASMSGESGGSVNTLYLSNRAGAWVLIGSTWIAGSMEVLLTTTGVYYGYIASALGGSTNISNIFRVVFEGPADIQADDNIPFVLAIMKDDAVYWPPEDDFDLFGQPVVQEPIQLSARWVEEVMEIIDATGTTRMSRANVTVDRDLKDGGILMQGTLDDVDDYADPKENEGAGEILKVTKLPDFDLNFFLRKVFL